MSILELKYHFENKYEDKTDEDVVRLIKQGDKNALNYLLDKYKDLVAMKANRFFMVGADKDDMYQEGLWGLYKAIQSFEFDKQNSFKTFANLCIERQLITAIKTSNRQKNIPLNSSFSLNTSAYDEDDDTSIMDILDLKTAEDPLDTIIKQEYFNSVQNRINENLSAFEKNVLNQYIQGISYVDIASNLEAPIKSVDNAIQRIRKKVIKFGENRRRTKIKNRQKCRFFVIEMMYLSKCFQNLDNSKKVKYSFFLVFT